MVKVTITCEDYYVADSLFNLGGIIESTDIMDDAYEGNGVVSHDGEHFKATIERID